MESIWKEEIMAASRYYSVICLEGLRKTTKNFRIAGIPRQHLPNTNLELYYYINLLGYVKFKFALQLSEKIIKTTCIRGWEGEWLISLWLYKENNKIRD
jgi:hypothetical protein